MQAGDRADQTADLGTLLLIGDGKWPTYTVVEYVFRWRWPEITEEALRQWHQPWRLYTLDRQPTTPWPLGDVWPRQGHLGVDFLQWDPRPYRPYDMVFVDNILCWGYATQSSDVSADTWESPTLHGYSRQRKLALWAVHLAALEAHYILTSGTADREDPEDGDVIPDMTAWRYRLVASRTYERRVHTGWYLWQRELD